MFLPDKFPNPPLNLVKEEVMGPKDWFHYFELRELRDHPVPDAELKAVRQQVITLIKEGKQAEADVLNKQIPLAANIAFSLKDTHGFKAIQEYNLYEAKQMLPDEF